MSWSKEITLWCDGNCSEWERFTTNRVSNARGEAERKRGWETGRNGDYCPDCKEEQ